MWSEFRLNLEECCKLLEVPDTIKQGELEKQWKKLVLKYHPDRNHSPGATEKFIKIKDAYEFVIKSLEQLKRQRQNPPTTMFRTHYGNPYSSMTSGNNGTMSWTFTFE